MGLRMPNFRLSLGMMGATCPYSDRGCAPRLSTDIRGWILSHSSCQKGPDEAAGFRSIACIGSFEPAARLKGASNILRFFQPAWVGARSLET
jgi:hypothetical protein